MIPSGTKFVGINPDFPTAERKSAQNNAAQDVYTIEEIATNVTLQQVSDNGGLGNGSTIRKGYLDNGYGGGISLVCVNEKEIQWEDGVQYYYPTGSLIVHANSINNDIPNEFYDETRSFTVGSRYTVLNTGKTYICTDATTEAAVWLPMGGEYTPVLSNPDDSITGFGAITTGFYSINNGIVDVTIKGNINVDFDAFGVGSFDFTLPTTSISAVMGNITFRTPNQVNGTILYNASIGSNDKTFIANDVAFVASFKYQMF